MSGTNLRDQKSSSKIKHAGSQADGQPHGGLTRKNRSTRQRSSYQWVYMVAIALVMLTMIGLQSLSLMWLSNERGHNQKVASEMERIQTDLADMRSSINANIAEDLICLKILVLNSKVPNQTAREIASVVYKHALRYERDPDLILAIMRIESGFDPDAVSRMGAIGLMQVMPQWIDVLDIRCELTDPDCNTRYGLQILGAYEQLYGGLEMALTAYNRGPGPVDYALMKGKSPDNGYAGKVKAVYDRLRAINRSGQELKVAYTTD